MLTPQWRFLYDLFIYRSSRSYEKLDRTGSKPGSNPTDEPFDLLADVDATAMDDLMIFFHEFRLRSNVDIENISEEFSCWQRFGKNLSMLSVFKEEPEVSALGWGAGVDKAGRHLQKGIVLGGNGTKIPDCLGFMGIFLSNTMPPLVEANTETDELNYLQWRVEKGVAEGSTEIPKGEAIPLEYNLAGLNAISFDKGCYVGRSQLLALTTVVSFENTCFL